MRGVILMTQCLGLYLLMASQPALLAPSLSQTLSPIFAPATDVLSSTIRTITGVPAPRGANSPGAADLARAATAAVSLDMLRYYTEGPAAVTSAIQNAATAPAPVVEFVAGLAEQLQAASGLTPESWVRYIPAWAPVGYTGPVSLSLRPAMLPASRPAESWIEKNGYLPYETANVTRQNIPGGYKVHIQHAPLPDVTPEQLQWWFLNIGGSAKNPSDGKVYPNYLLMHPRDHIQGFYPYFNNESTGGKGATIRYTEIFMSNETDGYLKTNSFATLSTAAATQAYIDMQLAVVESNEHGVKYEARVPGVELPVFILEWRWSPREAPLTGVDFTTDITYLPYLSLPGDAYRVLLRGFRGIDDKMYRHIVEEVGNLNEIVPKVYAQRL
eukprot:jgi/Botrbrau1/2565/Bobra.0079s0050.1